MLTLSRSDAQHEPKAQKARGPVWRFLQRQEVSGYLFIMPWIIGFLLFYLYPLISTFYDSFTDYRLFGDPQWIGLKNYQKLLFQDQTFREAASHMLIYVVLATLIYILAGLGLALLLNRAFPGNHFFRTVFYLPSLMVGVAIGSMFVQVFQPGDFGLINEVIGVFHIHAVNWLSNYDQPIMGLFALILVNFWFVGGTMLIFLAGLKGISSTYYEAARIDGANAWQGFRFITLPLLAPVILFNMVLTLIGHIQVFDTPLIFAGLGTGSIGISTSVLGYRNTLSTFLTYLYQEAFINHNYGYGSAIAIVIFLVTLALTGMVLLAFRNSSSLSG